MAKEPGTPGQLFIVSAPSGTGKTTLIERLVRELPAIRMSRSYTSRACRPGEQDGVDYNFISREEFERRRDADVFLEWAEVFGNFYGTSRVDTDRVLADGEDLVLVIDVQGARQVRSLGRPHTAIFVLPPSADVLEQRLRGRSKDSDEQIQRRLRVARCEVSDVSTYHYVVINDHVDACVARLRSIVLAERARVERMRPVTDAVLNTFRKD